MNGVHDMGGTDGFGPVTPEVDEPVFHQPWEGRVIGMLRAMALAGAWNIDQSRYGQERLNPVDYLGSSYYERMLLMLEKNLTERDIVSVEEIESGRSLRSNSAPQRATAEQAASLAGRPWHERETSTNPQFAVGDEVRAKNIHPKGHTRLPRYARGHTGRIVLIHGFHTFADSMAASNDENPQWLYAVAFDAAELWGSISEPTTILIDAFEPYLEPV